MSTHTREHAWTEAVVIDKEVFAAPGTQTKTLQNEPEGTDIVAWGTFGTTCWSCKFQLWLRQLRVLY